MAPVPRRRCCVSCCWPLAGHHWYRPVRKRPGLGSLHNWPYRTGTISPNSRRLGRGLLQYGLLTVVVAVLIIWLGSEYERFHVRNSPSTGDLYSTSEVCGIVNASSEIHIESFASVADFRDEHAPNDVAVAHCGNCGGCSNPNDVHIYDNTRNTLFQDTTHCAKKALIWGRKTATKCMAEAVGFTNDCNDCWVENIMCDLRYCIFTCIWYGLFSQVDGVAADNNSTQLNPCTHCDEMRCGREFVTCAGANRRRAGILSDIERDTENEVCRDVTPEWWNDPVLDKQWRAQHPDELYHRAPPEQKEEGLRRQLRN